MPASTMEISEARIGRSVASEQGFETGIGRVPFELQTMRMTAVVPDTVRIHPHLRANVPPETIGSRSIEREPAIPHPRSRAKRIVVRAIETITATSVTIADSVSNQNTGTLSTQK
jgi:hypothetical protein